MTKEINLASSAVDDLNHTIKQMWDIGREDKAFAWAREVLKRHSDDHQFDFSDYLKENFGFQDKTTLVAKLQANLKDQAQNLDIDHHNYEQNLADLGEMQTTKDCLWDISRDRYTAIYQGDPDTPDVNRIHPINQAELIGFINYVTGYADDIPISDDLRERK